MQILEGLKNMIVTIRGKLTEKQPLKIIVEIAGIGYGVETPMSTFYKLPDVGANVFLFTQVIIREDAHLLFGFSTERERALFQSLIKVSGIGPKVALSILSSLDPDIFMQIILDNNVSSLIRVPGVGKKTAERLIVEMRDKIQQLDLLPTSGVSTRQLVTQNSPMSDALSALVSLGYKHDIAKAAISKWIGENPSSEELIKFALQNV